MFKQNKYYTWYCSIIQYALQRINTQNTENHHIVPRCAGGSNDKSNIVCLSFREHFICHKLLTKCFVDEVKAKRMFSAMCMVRSKKLKREVNNSKKYEHYRKIGILSLLGTTHTAETKLKIKQALTGKKHSEDRIQKIKKTLSLKNSGVSNPNAKQWRVYNLVTKESFTCCGNLLQACKARGLSGYLLMEKLRKNQPPASRGRTANWAIELLL